MLKIQLILRQRSSSTGRPVSFETTTAVATFDTGFAARAPVVFLVEAPSEETVAVLTDGSWAATEVRKVRRGGGAGGHVVAHFVCYVFSRFGILVAVMNGCYIKEHSIGLIDTMSAELLGKSVLE